MIHHSLVKAPRYNPFNKIVEFQATPGIAFANTVWSCHSVGSINDIWIKTVLINGYRSANQQWLNMASRRLPEGLQCSLPKKKLSMCKRKTGPRTACLISTLEHSPADARFHPSHSSIPTNSLQGSHGPCCFAPQICNVSPLIPGPHSFTHPFPTKSHPRYTVHL